MTKCPRCKETVIISPLVYWKGCECCNFGKYEYDMYPPYGGYEYEYREAMRKAFKALALEREKKEVDKLCEGVL